MTKRQIAACDILSAAQFLKRDDALALIEAQLRLAFLDGEAAGLEAAKRAVEQVGIAA